DLQMEAHLACHLALESAPAREREQPSPKLRKPLQKRWQRSVHHAEPHSTRRAVIGSTLVARRAGTQHASNATKISSSAIPTNVSGSVALTPCNILFSKRVTVTAAAAPTVTPSSVSPTPCPMTRRKTSRLCPPSASRTPISCVRCVTAYESAPYSPIAAITNPMTANTPYNVRLKRR